STYNFSPLKRKNFDPKKNSAEDKKHQEKKARIDKFIALKENLIDWKERYFSREECFFEKNVIDTLMQKIDSFTSKKEDTNKEIENLLYDLQCYANLLKCLCILPPISNQKVGEEIFDSITNYIKSIRSEAEKPVTDLIGTNGLFPIPEDKSKNKEAPQFLESH